MSEISRRSSDDAALAERAALRRCRQGQIEGLETLYQMYAERVFRTCLRILQDRPAAEDQTHEVFLRVFERIDRFDGRSRFSTWLYRLAVNGTLNRLRRRRLSKLRQLRPSAEVRPRDLPDRVVVAREAGERVQRLLSALSPDHRTILVLREIEELSYAEIAEVLGVPHGTVMSRLHRARQELKRHWQARNGAGPADVERERRES